MHLLSDIALFIEVVNTKSFSRAADNLAMPASTLSRRISLLEKTIGLRLLNRTTRRVEVTDAGAAYYARCAPLVAQATLAHEQISDTVNIAQGTLRLGCSPDFAMLYLPVLLTAFARQYPAVNIELELSYQRADLLAEHLDAALRIGMLKDSSLVARQITALKLGLFAAPSYLTKAHALTQPIDLSTHQCIRMNTDERGSNWDLQPTDNSSVAVRVPVKGQIVCSSMGMICQMAIQGAGIGVMDCRLAKPEVAAGKLVPVLPAWQLHPVPLYMVTPSRLQAARTRLFGDYLTQWFSDLPQPAS